MADNWSNKEICTRWAELFSANDLIKRYLKGEILSKAEEQLLQSQIDHWRERLSDISWFMRCLNEPVARQANREESVTGRFYEYPPWYSPFGPASYLSCSN
ncbi:MAG: hypothetical protein GY746_17360 [Gammaproteobacteria bacterium]|nr:hypothetical protein [Gammaproteobacteria bacterium]